MANRRPLARALLTVFQRLGSSWLMGLFVGFYALMTIAVSVAARVTARLPPGEKMAAVMPTFLIIPLWLFGILLALHVKEQFAAPRARLVPGFARAHLGTAGLWLALLIAVSCAGVAGLPGFPVLRTVAFFTALAAVCVWNGLLTAVWLNLLVTAGFILLMNRPVWVAAFIGRAPAPVAPVLLVLSVAAFVGAARWLARLHEEVPAYHRQWGMKAWASLQPGRADTAEAARHSPLFSRYTTWLMRPRWMPPRRTVLREPFLREVRRLMAADMPRRTAWMSALVFLVFIGLINAATGQSHPESFFPALLILPVLQLASMWQARAAGFGQELLRPVERPHFFRQLAAAWSIEMFNAWLAVHAAGTALVLLAGDSGRWRPLLAPALAATAVANLFMLAAALYWIPRARSGQGAVFGLLVLMIPLGAWTAGVFGAGGVRAGVLAGGLVALPLLALGLGALAYRRWMRADA